MIENNNIPAIIIDDFFDNPDEIRDYLSSLTFYFPTKEQRWIGSRTIPITHTMLGIDVDEYIKNKLSTYDIKYKNLVFEWYFHLMVETDKGDGIFELKERHTDDDYRTYAGVIYLTPNPPENTGTTFFGKDEEIIGRVQNKYNRFVFYEGSIPHSVTNPFGKSGWDGRMALTMFGNIED